MDLREQLSRRRKDARWIVGGLTALLFVLTAIYYGIQRSRELPSALITNRVLLFVLLYANAILILTILAVLLRNVFKLFVERRNRILGSKFRIKLVFTYIGLSLLPVLLLFAYGTQLLQGWIDRWFDEPAVRRVLEEGNAVAQELNSQIERIGMRDASRLIDELEGTDLRSTRSRPELARLMQQMRDELEADYLAIYDGTQFVHAVINPQSGLRDLPEPGRRFLNETIRNSEAVQIRQPSTGRGRLILAAVTGELNPEGKPRIAITGRVLAPEISEQSEQLILAYQGFRQLEAQKGEIQAGYLLTFLLVTLLILLASSWVGLYLARRVTVPIQALADGTRQISTGDLDFRVETAADDELGVLVSSFNSMTRELKRNKEEIVAANQRLTEERALIAAVLENVAAGVISIDQQGRILTCNGAALAMLKIRQQKISGRRLSDIWADGELRKLADLFEVVDTDLGQHSRNIRLVVGGEWKTFEAKISTMRDRSGRPSGRVMVLEDLSQLIRAQQVAAWNDAARRVAHEVKNPLTPIKLSAERLLRQYEQGNPNLGEILQESSHTIIREVETMKTMVDEFSRFARMPEPQPKEIQFQEFLAGTVKLYERVKPGVDIVTDVAPEVKSAWADPEQLKSVLINLLDNAVAATSAPGEVRISVSRNDPVLKMVIADTGPGIPPEAKDKLFLPHFSTKGRGTGLGLSIVHRIVSDHHGTIQVGDNDPHGTIFTIELPQQ